MPGVNKNVYTLRRVVVVGTSGSGKTTLAGQLARRLNVPHVELDALHWQPNWTSTPRDQMVEKARAALDAADRSHDGWTVCGHYGKVRDVTWSRADTVIFLDYPMTTVFSRVFRRTFRRWWYAEELWNGNRESLWTQFCQTDSLFLWVIQTWRKNRHDIPQRLRDPCFAHLRAMRFRSPEALEDWMQSVAATRDAV
jgi:adenylate kinase family enzyme